MTAWWARYAIERYGQGSSSAATAWQALHATVYGIDERANATEGGFKREKAKGGLLAFPLAHSYNDQISHWWYPVNRLVGAWRDLTVAATELPPALVADPDGTYVYDLVNVGRECLDRAADVLFGRLAAATSAAGVGSAGDALLQLHSDADALLCTAGGFSLARVLDQAAKLGQAAGQAAGQGAHAATAGASTAAGINASFFDRMARAQVTTWLPACQTKAEFAGGVCSVHVNSSQAPPLEDYANKAWGGPRAIRTHATTPPTCDVAAQPRICSAELVPTPLLAGGLVRYYYGGRVQCYVSQARSDFSAGAGVNATAVFACIDELSRTFQADTKRSAFPICNQPVGDAVALSKALAAKYGPLLE